VYWQDEELADHRLVLYSSDDPRRKANAALLLCLYVVRAVVFVYTPPLTRLLTVLSSL
jgi:hypothetical protein